MSQPPHIVPPVSPYFLNKPLSHYARGWNLFLRDRPMSDAAHDWQWDGWLAAKKYAGKKHITKLPCPDDYKVPV